MPAPDKTYDAEFYEIEPPVIPVKFTRPKGRGKPGPISMKGFEGFKLLDTGRGNFRVMRTGDFTLKVLGDGYAEIPDTIYNRKKLKTLSKATVERPTYNRTLKVDVDDPNKFWFRNKKDELTLLTDDAIDEGEIRKISKGGTTPATVKPLNSKRDFDMRNVKQAELCERVRPWLLDFVKVNAAIMEAPAI